MVINMKKSMPGNGRKGVEGGAGRASAGKGILGVPEREENAR